MSDPVQPVGTVRSIPNFIDSVFTPDGSSLLGVVDDGSVQKIDLATGQQVYAWQVGSGIRSVDVTPDGHYLVAAGATAGNSIVGGQYVTTLLVYRLDLHTGAVTTFQDVVPQTAFAFNDIATVGNGAAILTFGGYTPQPLVSLDLNSGTFTSSQDLVAADLLTPSADHHDVLIAPSSALTGNLYRYTAGQGIVATTPNPGESFYNAVQTISAHGTYEAVADVPGRVTVYDTGLHSVADLTALHPEFSLYPASGLSGQVTGLAFTPDEQHLFVADSVIHKIYELSTADWKIEASYALTLSGQNNGLRISSDGHYLLSGNNLIDLTKAVPVVGGFDDPNILNTALDGEVLYGFGGNDTLTGDSGTLVGGAGDDIYYSAAEITAGPHGFPYVTNSNIIELPDGGFDTLYTSNHAVAANVERIIGTSPTLNILNGDDGANTIVGNTGTDLISSGLGIDLITTGGGADQIYGPRAALAGDTVKGFAIGDEITVSDNDPLRSLSYHRSGEALNLGEGATLTLSGTYGGHFILQFFQQLINVPPQPDNPIPNIPVGAGYMGGPSLLLRPASPNMNDFNGDGHGELLWRNVNGDISTWSDRGIATMSQSGTNGAPDLVHNTLSVTGILSSWSPVGTSDFNNDGLSDIVWHNSNTGQIAVWDATGSGDFAQSSFVSGSLDLGWKVSGLGDFNGDGLGDILWRHSNGWVSVWTSTGSDYRQNTFADYVDASWHVQAVGDFNGDGRDDLLWRSAMGQVNIWNGTATGFAENSYDHAPVGLQWHVAAAGDLNADGRADIVWHDDAGDISVWLANAGGGFSENAFPAASAATSWHIVGLTDFDDDGRDDIIWRNDNGALSIWQSTGTDFIQAAYNDHTVGNDWSIVHQPTDMV